ncbi:PWWP domain-containing protein [Verticillium dahliae VdLs.17]|uniref:PWWP domain-containing protein n=1 Tax=Verticillium dahliae (strain VdLs.17 / ATCC MYA-4575 / FGSC 10137) TaxID=498257 RepID=G2X2Z6_VERDV|nr:PWWP domain-containing protein [Verticillium dahliae VdLs.17]EGY22752.1 PWWP domain-containing protein [Verticillium dahliae VdLs.17]
MSDDAAGAPATAPEQVEKKEEAATTVVHATEDSVDKPVASDETVEAPAAAASEDSEAKKSAAESAEAAAAPDSDGAPAAEADAKASEGDAKDSEAKPSDAASAQDKDDKDNDAEMKDADATAAADDDDSAAAAADESAVLDTPAGDKSKGRRKSTSAAEAKGKKLNKKGSKARILHLDAKPGEHYLVKLKGHPQWPVIIADEDMLPPSLTEPKRPVTCLQADGTYREDFADGGKRVADRTFPVMYLHTNEFSYVPNSFLQELSSELATEMLEKKIKNKKLEAAFELAVEQNSLEFYKDLLNEHAAELAAKEAAAEDAAAAAASKKKKRASIAAVETEDVDMADAYDEEVEDVEVPAKSKSSKKRKAEEAATPQRSDSAKKPKIKLTTSSTPKATNGTSTPKAAKESAAKPAKTKSKKDGAEKKAEKETPKEPELSAEEKHQRKEREVLFLRHKLQKGLLTREQIPQGGRDEDDVRVSIIRATKINKVLKAILKLDSIPKEAEFNFKSRSQALLDKWTKILSTVDGVAAPSTANGVNGNTEKKTEPNGIKDEAKVDAKSEEAAEAKKSTPEATEETEAKPEGTPEKTANAQQQQQHHPGSRTAPAKPLWL